jgi:hypothetical protein
MKKVPLPAGAHAVSVTSDAIGTISLADSFTVKNPGLDPLADNSGRPGEEILVTGNFFGNKKGKAYLYDPVNNKNKSLKITDWKMNPSTGASELTFVVPKSSKNFPAGLYQLKISNKIGPASTSPEFTVLEPGP